MSQFPATFLWGASTSAYQVEGGSRTDWSMWEATHRDWPRVAQAANHYNRFEEDFDLAAKLSHTAHRFSIEWARVEPKPGEYSQEALDHYRAVVAALRARQIEPIVTLWHWTLPTWVAEQGGWLSPETAPAFQRFVGKVVSALGQDVRYWATLNEPEVYAANAYLTGKRPPSQRNPASYLRVLYRLASAHRDTYRTIHQLSPQAKVGIAKDCYAFVLARPTWPNRFLRFIAHTWRNVAFLHLTRRHLDWIGLNYYVCFMVDSRHPLRLGGAWRDLGPQGAPTGLSTLLSWASRYKLPLIITENGVNDADDSFRGVYITEIIEQLSEALQQNIPLIGYLHWSLLDCFEWDSGYGPKFGLIAVDYGSTLTRTPRASAFTYARLIRSNQA